MSGSATGKWRTSKTIDHIRVHPPSAGMHRVTHHYSDGSRPKEHLFSSRTAVGDHVMGMLPRSEDEPERFEHNPEEEA